MKDVWVKVDLINGESYIGTVENFDSEDLLSFLDEQSYFGIKLENVNTYQEVDGKIIIKPLDAKDSMYDGKLIIMSPEHIVTIKFLKNESEIFDKFNIKKIKTKKNKRNVVPFKLLKKENK
ncbi:MAG: hypothetical protein ACPLW6_06500 [Desulfurella sp.]|uniref:Uncharacterized protein n=1 Tax=Desulfurella multipotens TaxID=79269 RepID=A0A1G6N2N5_9BACT|nr:MULTISPECIES: hypothetical protein [Desulfurella]AHF98268.1 hypothetical protein DESACE_09530 [Desulfurella acetivorans A63]HEX14305.1 hypothetical protein [Desulfurella acetivorans]PMP68918.1 MAG: hypothetical protein C0192_01230 [Desulfurella multipotens]PMP90230.1 MAG: hypothetical protein C0173_04720 [Desulfurella sp.]SDC62083.1 hypothetical protein SAMN05660835_01094 [Desulfurella multipotens]